MASNNPTTYRKFVGRVEEVVNRYKAVVEFQDLGVKQRALLKVDKLICKRFINPDGHEDHPIDHFIHVGSTVKGLCHQYYDSKDQKYGWYVAEVEAVGESLTDPSMVSGLCPSMHNKIGWISHLEKRQGVITTKDEAQGDQHEVLFLASKFFVGGKRINVKHPLDKYVNENEKVFFDAVPIDSEENSKHCTWFATLVWQRAKPSFDYSLPIELPDPHLAQIKMIIRSPKSHFIRGKGQIMQILNESYGIALGAVNKQQTHWQSILFHRSSASLFKYNLKDVDLRKVFKEGDKIRFIAASAPKSFIAQWVAAFIGVDVVGDAQQLLQISH